MKQENEWESHYLISYTDLEGSMKHSVGYATDQVLLDTVQELTRHSLDKNVQVTYLGHTRPTGVSLLEEKVAAELVRLSESLRMCARGPM